MPTKTCKRSSTHIYAHWELLGILYPPNYYKYTQIWQLSRNFTGSHLLNPTVELLHENRARGCNLHHLGYPKTCVIIILNQVLGSQGLFIILPNFTYLFSIYHSSKKYKNPVTWNFNYSLILIKTHFDHFRPTKKSKMAASRHFEFFTFFIFYQKRIHHLAYFSTKMKKMLN